ncbi:hypothetical protein NL108_015853 [Boleophthalmus pectinirostris]|nr:hypothetical protein NL108_015853 [Boleophthalmus pectinirostris]
MKYDVCLWWTQLMLTGGTALSEEGWCVQFMSRCGRTSLTSCVFATRLQASAQRESGVDMVRQESEVENSELLASNALRQPIRDEYPEKKRCYCPEEGKERERTTNTRRRKSALCH